MAQRVDNERMHQLQIKDESMKADTNPATGCTITPDLREINNESEESEIADVPMIHLDEMQKELDEKVIDKIEEEEEKEEKLEKKRTMLKHDKKQPQGDTYKQMAKADELTEKLMNKLDAALSGNLLTDEVQVETEELNWADTLEADKDPNKRKKDKRSRIEKREEAKINMALAK